MSKEQSGEILTKVKSAGKAFLRIGDSNNETLSKEAHLDFKETTESVIEGALGKTPSNLKNEKLTPDEKILVDAVLLNSGHQAREEQGLSTELTKFEKQTITGSTSSELLNNHDKAKVASKVVRGLHKIAQHLENTAKPTSRKPNPRNNLPTA